jgi:superfamily I DNA/RNA helicase
MLYTGITRAEVKLWLTHAPVKIYGVRQVCEQPSAFLDTGEVRAALKYSADQLKALRICRAI